MSLMSQIIASSAPGSGGSIELPTLILENAQRESSETIYSGIKIDADGYVYRRSTYGTWQNVSPWLLNGSASTYYVSMTINSGTLTTSSGTGPLQCSTDRSWEISGSSTPKTATITLTLADNTTGAPVLKSRQYFLSIETP